MLRCLRLTTAGETHGPAVVAVLEGMPAGLPLEPDDVARELARRQQGHGRGGRMRIEKDVGEIFGGVRLGETIGSPIAIRIPNLDYRNWVEAMAVAAPEVEDEQVLRRAYLPRPGHADLVGILKYERKDVRDILERASARETAARVAAGAVAKRLLGEFGVRVESHVVRIGPVAVPPGQPLPDDLTAVADASPVRCIDDEASAAMVEAIDAARRAGDSLGGVFEVVARGAPVGLGSHVTWESRLGGRLGGALMSIHAMKGVEVGMGFEAARLRGSEVHDEIESDPGRRRSGGYRRRRNNAGGLEGGITTGGPVVARVAMKPLSSLRRPLDSVDTRTDEPAKAFLERSDVCSVPAAGVVGEAMMALVLADAWIEKFAGDSLSDMRRNVESYLARLRRDRDGGARTGQGTG
ncbi:chorismate synthase [Candidatus Palauibacter sp.]|uniref:chorismate synthase n=1 Tax=Candidatus Palauibacter sp. TaxID=3101350 RepID=UPI003B01E541